MKRTVIWVGCGQNHAVYLLHVFHLVEYPINESSNLLHLQKALRQPCGSAHGPIQDTLVRSQRLTLLKKPSMKPSRSTGTATSSSADALLWKSVKMKIQRMTETLNGSNKRHLQQSAQPADPSSQ